jgi:hypothetical protein
VVGDKIYYVPSSLEHVGVLDTTTNEWSTIALTGQSAGGRAVHVAPITTRIQIACDIYGVCNQRWMKHISTFDFKILIPPAPLHPGTTFWGNTIAFKYSGAVAVGNKVIFAPSGQDNVGVLETYATLPPSPPPAAPPSPPPALTDATFNTAISSCLVGRCRFTLLNPR